MPKLTAKYKLDDIDLSLYPSSITLQFGKGNQREWWEWRDGDKSIVIQRHHYPRASHPDSWLVFFLCGTKARTLELPLTDEDKANRIVARTFGTYLIDEAIKTLAELGIVANRS